MKIAIIGTGGVGGYFGGKLANAGNEVTFLARGEHLKVIRKNGLTIKSIQGDFKVSPAKATDKIGEIESPDLIILGVKAWQIKELAPEITKIIGNGTAVLPLQNGILAAEELEEHMNRKHILGGLCRIISKIEAPGVINHFGVDPTIVFGEIDRQVTDRAKTIKSIFDAAGIRSHISADIDADLWKKFISICTSGLLAVTRTTYGELLEFKETRGMLITLLEEIYQLSQKVGINIEPNFVERNVAFLDTLPYHSTSSLTRDVWESKPSEIEYQNGTVVRLAEKFGVEVPVNKFVYHCILPMEKKARS